MTPWSRYTLYVLISTLAGAAGLILTEILIRFHAIPVIDVAIPPGAVSGRFLLLKATAQGAREW